MAREARLNQWKYNNSYSSTPLCYFVKNRASTITLSRRGPDSGHPTPPAKVYAVTLLGAQKETNRQGRVEYLHMHAVNCIAP